MQVLELDPEKGTVPASEADRVVVKNLGIGQKHNLEVSCNSLYSPAGGTMYAG